MRLVFFVLLLTGWSRISAQVPDTLSMGRNIIYGELWGNAGILSINYERLFLTESPVTFSARVGVGFYPYDLGLFGGKATYSGVVPVSFSVLYGRKILLETGVGASLGWDDSGDAFGKSGPIRWFNGMLMFRYHSPRGFVFRIGFTPMFSFPSECVNTQCLRRENRMHMFPFLGISPGFRIRGRN